MVYPLVHSKASTDLVTSCYGPSIHRITTNYINDTEFRLGKAKVQHLSDVPKQAERSKRPDAECIKKCAEKKSQRTSYKNRYVRLVKNQTS